ncbi:hypothetical protein HDU88_003661 [Geranomyces variabilis]|nr:hypothetical protein HDU88_003661 [Geranomyces variabilis]
MSEQEPLLPVVAPPAEGEQAPQGGTRRSRTLTPPDLGQVPGLVVQTYKRLKARFGNGNNSNGESPTAEAGPSAPHVAIEVGPTQVAAPAQSPTRRVPHSTVTSRLADRLNYYSAKLNPLGPPVESVPATAAADPGQTALIDIVTMIAEDFAAISLPVDRHRIRTILTTTIVNIADFVTIRDQLAGKSWQIREDTLRPFFGAVDASAEDYTVPAGIQAFYARARELHLSDVALLHERFARRFHHPPFLAKLEGLIANAQAHNTDRVVLRYIGTVRGLSTPRERYDTDIATSASLFGKIDYLLAQMQADGQLISPGTWTVAEFVRLRTDFQTPDDDGLLDFIERVLISLFGYDSLINVQRGGYFAEYTPADEDLELFSSLNVNLVGNLHSMDTSPGLHPTLGTPILILRDKDKNVVTHFENVFAYIRQNPSLVCNRNVDPHSRIVFGTIRQAVPRIKEVFGGTLVLLIGKDATLEDYDPKLETARFLHGTSRAGHLTRILLGALRDRDPSTPHQKSLADFLDLLPFVDLYPWLIREHVVQAMDYLSQYMCIVRPWITVTFSKEVFQVITRGFAPFGNLAGAPGSQHFLDFVGVPRVSNFDKEWIHDETSHAAPDNAFTVQIPHYHAGRDKYGDQAPILRRVLLLSWMATLVTIQEAFRLFVGLTRRKSTPATRLQACEQIVTSANNRLRDTGFTEVFDAAKAQLRAHLANTAGAVARRKLTEDAKTRRRAKMAITRAATLELIGARGAPYSDERREQAELLWTKKFEPLGQHMPYNDNEENGEAWLQWVMERSQGVSLVTAAISRRIFDATAQERRDMIDSLAFEDANLDTEAVLMAALAERLEAMRTGRAASEAFRNAQRDRMLRRWNDDPTAVRETAKGRLEGTEVTILKKYARFYAYVGEELKSFRLLLSPTQLARAREHRAVLRFVQDGIRLEDEGGNDLEFFLAADRMPFVEGLGRALQTVRLMLDKDFAGICACGRVPAPIARDH